MRPAASLFPPGPRQLGVGAAATHRDPGAAVAGARVIARMLEHNLAAIRYPDYRHLRRRVSQ